MNKGEPPIYFGFGSVFRDDEKNKWIEIIIKALQKSGKRGIICGMGDIQALPHSIFAIQSISHTWLFPRVSAVCHHGGAGTTAAGFRAGIPSIIIPFSNDQFAWEHRAYDLGVEAKPIPQKQLGADNLAEAIKFALQSRVVEQSKVLSQKIATENGASVCAKIVIETMNK